MRWPSDGYTWHVCVRVTIDDTVMSSSNSCFLLSSPTVRQAPSWTGSSNAFSGLKIPQNPQPHNQPQRSQIRSEQASCHLAS